MIIQNISVALLASTLNFCWEKKRRKPSREALKFDVTIKGSVSQFASDQPVKKAANDLGFFLQVFTPNKVMSFCCLLVRRGMKIPTVPHFN